MKYRLRLSFCEVAGLLVAGGMVAGCSGAVADPTFGATGGGGRPAPVGSPPGRSSCFQGVLEVGPTRLRRLTSAEYVNTVRDVLGIADASTQGFTSDEFGGGFAANATAPISPLQFDTYVASAERIAGVIDLASLAGCDVTELACRARFVTDTGRRLLRRPVNAEEQAAYSGFLETETERWGAERAVQMLLEAWLVSPHFLYLVEGSSEALSGQVALDAYAIASRLSYFLWHSAPDDSLLDGAEAGELASSEGVAAQARRMLEDSRADGTIAVFHDNWLSLHELEAVVRDPEINPEWNASLPVAMREETHRFVSRTFREEGTLSALLSASHSYVDNDDLANLYGVEASALGRVALDPAERAGLLTQASFFTVNAHADGPSVVSRGKFVRERLLCDTLTPPPPTVDTSELGIDRMESPECVGCHVLMDPIGEGFAQYDEIGVFRGGDPAVGELISVGDRLDVSGPFAGPVDLAHKLAGSRHVSDCVASQWYRYAHRRSLTEADACAVDRVQHAFADSGGDLTELLVAIATEEAFRYRGTEESP